MLKRPRENGADINDVIKKKGIEQVLEKEKELSELTEHSKSMTLQRYSIQEELHRAKDKAQVLTLNVGGESFTILKELVEKLEEKDTYFHRLLDDSVPKTVTADGAVYIDRDPESFRNVLNYIRGYGENYFHLLDEDTKRLLKSDADFYQLEKLSQFFTETSGDTILFNPGPGVNPDRNRQCVAYSVITIGDVFLVTGRHEITLHIINSDYVGVGLISESCVERDREHHKAPDSCVYYMSGVFYSNFSYHRKEENLEQFGAGDYVTICLDMDRRQAEFKFKNSSKIISLGKGSRLKFAVTMKSASRVRIVN